MIDAGKIHGGALACRSLLDRLAMNLQAANARALIRWVKQNRLVASCDGSDVLAK